MTKVTTEQMRLRRGGSYTLPEGASAADADEAARTAEDKARADEQAELDKQTTRPAAKAKEK